LLFLFFVSVFSEVVTISNSDPRRSLDGSIMDAHDSKLVLKDGLYHWFAASYGECLEPAGNSGCAGLGIGKCGFRTDHNVTLFTSPDLVTWTKVAVVFGAAHHLPDQSVLFAPKTVFNRKTNTWVMWFNYIVGSFSNSFYGIATSQSAAGPFTMVVNQVKTLAYSDNGDENLFVDDDGQGYIIYTSIKENHGMSVERLTPDYLGSLGKAGNSGVVGTGVEAPSMFKRGSLYYIAFGSTCCYCESGSEVSIYTATSPLGPFTKRTSLGQLQSQSTDIFAYTAADNSTQFLYIGDHWQSAPDRVKGHDFTVWAPLNFSEDGLSVTTPGFQNNFTISVLIH